MKKLIYLLIVTLGMISCISDKESSQGDAEFIAEYSTTINVGGVVGITERTFEIGESYRVTDKGLESVTIRIAEHTELNDDCPNSWCYQELLEIPKEFLKFVDETKRID